jgi:hypothetical protein
MLAPVALRLFTVALDLIFMVIYKVQVSSAGYETHLSPVTRVAGSLPRLGYRFHPASNHPVCHFVPEVIKSRCFQPAYIVLL